jgi:dihydroflavonol-4-reductase
MAHQPQILVTGATGLLGSHLLFQLVAAGEAVRVLVRSLEKKPLVLRVFGYYHSQPEVLMEQVEWVQGDPEDITDVADAFEGIHTVYHCAAMVSFRPADKDDMIRKNVLLTANLVDVALHKGVHAFCHVSSVAALGRGGPANTMIDEKRLWKESSSNSNYAKSKYLSEMEVWRGIEEGLPATIVNPGIILGPGFWNAGSSRFFKAMHDGFSFTSSGVNGFVDVRDVAALMVALVSGKHFGERFIAIAENAPYNEVFSGIASQYGKQAPTRQPPLWIMRAFGYLEVLRSTLTGSYPLVTPETAKTAVQKSYYNNKKASELPGYAFRPLSETIRDFCRFYLRDFEDSNR